MLSLLILPLATKTIFNVPLISSKVKVENEAESNTWTIKNNIEELKKLRNPEWKALSAQEKIDVLQIVANIEARALGMSNKLCLGVKAMPDYVIGQYAVDTNIIYINIDKIRELGVTTPEQVETEISLESERDAKHFAAYLRLKEKSGVLHFHGDTKKQILITLQKHFPAMKRYSYNNFIAYF